MVKTCKNSGGKRGYEEIQEAKRNEEGNSAVQPRNNHKKFWGVKKRRNEGMKKGRNEAAEEMNKERKKKFRNQESKEIWNKQTTVRDFTAPCRLSLTMSKSWGGGLVAHLS